MHGSVVAIGPGLLQIAVLIRHANGQLGGIAAQSHGVASLIAIPGLGTIKVQRQGVLRGIAVANVACKPAAIECAVGKTEQMHRTRRTCGVAGTRIVGGTHHHAVASAIQRHGAAKAVAIVELDVDVAATGVAMTDRAGQCPAAKAGVGKGKEVNCPGTPAGVA